MRPLVVVTGQGISRADGFDLERELRKAPEPELQRCFELPRDGGTLDDVFSAARAHSTEFLEQLVWATRRICMARRRESGCHEDHRAVFQALHGVAHDRLVLHLTTNIDGIATMVAVGEFGALWPPYHRETHFEEVRREIGRALRGGRGLIHIPVHGEAGLAAVKGPPEWEGARNLVMPGEAHPSAYSTLAQGIGKQVREIETLMVASQLGYGLLLSLPLGETIGVDGPVGPYPPADLLAIGYGAGGTPGRDNHPFERKIDQASGGGRDLGEARWRTLIYNADSPEIERTVQWYQKRGFEVFRYGDGELAIG